MFKGTSENASFHKRVASHSTKPFARGRVDVLPPHVKQDETVYSDLKSQFETVAKQLQSLDLELADVNRRLSGRLVGMDGARLKSRRVAIIEQIRVMRIAKGVLRLAGRKAGEKSFTSCFWVIAQVKLSPDVFASIEFATRELMGRTCHELPRGSRRWSQNARKREEREEKEANHVDT